MLGKGINRLQRWLPYNVLHNISHYEWPEWFATSRRWRFARAGRWMRSGKFKPEYLPGYGPENKFYKGFRSLFRHTFPSSPYVRLDTDAERALYGIRRYGRGGVDPFSYRTGRL